MELYHYSTEQYDTVKSLTAQGKAKDIAHMGDYNKSSSFFNVPIPRNIASIYGGEHEFWQKDKVLYEHVLTTAALPKVFNFRLVEMPEKTELVYKQQWYEGMPAELITKNINEVRDLEKRLGYIGVGLSQLHTAMRRMPKDLEPHMRKAYELAKKYPDDGILSKYAATVPHIMIYSDLGVYQVTRVNKIKIT